MAYYYGTSGNDVITGTTDADVIYGWDGNDTLNGGAGNDELDGGAGDDVMIGGAGDDIYWVDSAYDVVTESAGGGTDLVRIRINSYTLGANIENVDTRYADTGPIFVTGNSLANIFIMGSGAVTVNGGAGSDTASYMNWDSVTVDLTTGEQTFVAADDVLTSIENLTGGYGDDVLRGTSGANILDGGAGADTLVGRAGNDIYYVDDVGDLVVENAGEGTDEVRVRPGTLTSYTLPDYVENLSYSGSDHFTGTGNGLNNTITGGTNSDTLYGGDGNDYLGGGSGADHLYGGDGNDTLDGGPSVDYLFGGTGNDVYILSTVGDQITEYEGEGTDTVYVSIATYILADNVENLNANASGVNFNLYGNVLDNVINGSGGNDYLDGDEGNDVVVGGLGDDVLQGGLGDDLVIGGAGYDMMGGGPGADVFKFSSFESGTGASADFISDFISGVDKIDLTGVDAALLTPGDQAFSFIGTDDFSGAGAELRYYFDGSNTIIQADINADGVSDFELVLQGAFGQVEPVVSDFML